MTPARRFTVACSALGVLAAIGTSVGLQRRDDRLIDRAAAEDDVATVHCLAGHHDWAHRVDTLTLFDGRVMREISTLRRCVRCGQVERKETTA